MDQNFLNRGFTDVFDVKITDELTQCFFITIGKK